MQEIAAVERNVDLCTPVGQIIKTPTNKVESCEVPSLSRKPPSMQFHFDRFFNVRHEAVFWFKLGPEESGLLLKGCLLLLRFKYNVVGEALCRSESQ
jgi:hypothetical protein